MRVAPSAPADDRAASRSAVLVVLVSSGLWRLGRSRYFPGEQGAVSYRGGPAERGAEIAPWAVGFGLLPWRVSESTERRRHDQCRFPDLQRDDGLPRLLNVANVPGVCREHDEPEPTGHLGDLVEVREELTIVHGARGLTA